MKKFFKNSPILATPLIAGIILTVIGIVLTVAPAKTLNIVCLALGIVVAIKAIERFVVYFKSTHEGKPKTFSLISGAIIAAFAVTLITHPKPILSFFPVIIGIGLLIFSIATFSFTSKIKSILMIIVSIIIINSPMLLAEAAISVVGIGLIIIGILTFITEIKAIKVLKDINDKLPESNYTEVDFTDVDD